VKGADETRPLDFHSPYGCSKGAADQYVRDYHRIYGLKTVVFRQSCIYGPRQMGVEDQGWVAWFVIASVLGKPLSIYGDGKQVRDLLYIDDLVNAYGLAVENIETTAGQIYNMGGGAENTISVWTEFQPLLARVIGRATPVPALGDWRAGDQKVFFCDTGKAARDFGWQPLVGVEEGVRRLADWVQANRRLFEGV
jgi:CDP-paratose 2-epimerase